MIKRFLLIITLLFLLHSTIIACDEEQSKLYVTQILFGVQAPNYRNNDKVKMLMDALYLCSEQSDGMGKERLDFLTQNDVQGVPSLGRINIKGDELFECSHIKWEDVYSANPKIQNNRKKILQYTVNTVFDFGFTNELFGNVPEKSNSFAALLYYFHILSDYLVDDPNETELHTDKYHIPSYVGKLCIELDNNFPFFSQEELELSPTAQKNILDGNKRAQGSIGKIRPKTLEEQRPERAKMPDPPGWQKDKGYNRCHLFAHQFGGGESLSNLVTCTGYLNNPGMTQYENEIRKFVDEKQRIVIYRITPHYKGDNQLPSGIQMEACSVADSCKGFHRNVYCYNIQPGVKIDYTNGDTYIVGNNINFNNVIPFAIYDANDNNPDLFLEIIKQLEILFADQKDSKSYKNMIGTIKSIANVARSSTSLEDKDLAKYRDLRKYENRLLDELTNYLPSLLMKESFFLSAFSQR